MIKNIPLTIYRTIARSLVLASIGYLALESIEGTLSQAKPVNFCHLPGATIGNIPLSGGGKIVHSTLPKVFGPPSQYTHLSSGYYWPLNRYLYYLPPGINHAGINCDTGLHGSGISPGSTMNPPDPVNVGVKISSNSYGFSGGNSGTFSNNGIHANNSSGFGSSFDNHEDDLTE